MAAPILTSRYQCHRLASRHAHGNARTRGLGYTHGYDGHDPEPSLDADSEYADAYLRGMADRSAVANGTYTNRIPDSRKRPPLLDL